MTSAQKLVDPNTFFGYFPYFFYEILTLIQVPISTLPSVGQSYSKSNYAA
jgi:hypothetical protein